MLTGKMMFVLEVLLSCLGIVEMVIPILTIIVMVYNKRKNSVYTSSGIPYITVVDLKLCMFSFNNRTS